ncbi:hypothetical protein CE91St19_16800 [Odoribacter laneus]|nr:hypothetical protein CE91St19_16800 [Odoribacter laneus]GKI24721.1 hypothetical protein CE91St20_08580 [Odoribacter laneus]
MSIYLKYYYQYLSENDLLRLPFPTFSKNSDLTMAKVQIKTISCKLCVKKWFTKLYNIIL